ncbi:1-deoxy-D-xylulose 5-phosphate reductoisomerase [Sporomusa silvacetica DSM 10669]|uniref:1-deoxy-D-xylulose 5-phosphate reductoisomerase n=1 Tax=Sporomusa silvacetica DSM 10669 TaxID=1123289 RepID=A0ABZ3ILD9_9FIRM|nr:1-deoxy-D-xylulose-5-phosphate reductoisomerase [Sporomusa silvacetica]OZC13496.1 1-deoxy-D-xylulose 5-phosphate reductoisomerase [Sporomusa silvacetica DSM 10669]
MKQIAILGSTGSIGTQALTVIAANADRYNITALAAYQNEKLLAEQIEYFKPNIAVLIDKLAADRMVNTYRGKTKILVGEEGLLEAATFYQTDTVLTSLVGFAGLKPTVAAIKAKKNIALANKETLVAAGELVMSLAKEYNVSISPVDSEHSAVFQCLNGENKQQINRIILTASGGPFRGRTIEEMRNVTIDDCLKHPNWSMGRKITIDSATLVNKGLEVIEAKWLFGVDYDNIDVCVHPQSIIHSMIEFIDGSIMAQLGMPDMRLPIQYALSYPERLPSKFPRLDLTTLSALTFAEPDTVNFPALKLAYSAGKVGGTMPCIFNAANEVAVYAFLNGEIGFLDIIQVIRYTMEKHTLITNPDLEQIDAADAWARQAALQVVNDLKKW